MEGEMGGLGDEYGTFRISLSLEVPKEKEKEKEEEDRVPYYFQRQPFPEQFVHPTRWILITDADQRVPVFRVNVSDPHCLNIMLNIRHPNILRAESIITGEKIHTLLVQPYAGNLVEYFEDQLYNHEKKVKDIIPLVQVIFQQIIDSMIYLMDNDLYHGDMKLENTYYCLVNGEPVIKLANFKAWTAPSEFDSDKLKSEWIHIGNALDRVIGLIMKHKPKEDLRFLCEMKDLRVELKTSRTTADQKKELAPRHFFFWTPEKRESVFTYNIPTLFQDKVFVSTVIKTFICPSDFIWNEAAYDGLLSTMNKYRESKFKTKYMGIKKTHYLKFVSGCYAHEKEFKEPLYHKTVDGTFRFYDPDLVVRVMRLLKAYEIELQKEKQKKP